MKEKMKIPDYIKYGFFIGIIGQFYITPVPSVNFYITIGVFLMHFILVNEKKEFNPFFLVVSAGIFSTLLKMILYVQVTPSQKLELFYSTMSYFLVYGILAFLVFRKMKGSSKNHKIIAAGILDFVSNLIEITTLDSLSVNFVRILFVFTLVRMVVIWVLSITYEHQRMLIIQQEHQKRYERLNDFIINIYAEVFYLKKSQKDLKEAMKLAHKIYGESKNEDALNVAIQIHEIKKDYYRLVAGLSGMIESVDDAKTMKVGRIFAIIRQSMEHQMESIGKKIAIVFKEKADGVLEQYYDIFVILNNLIINAVDACKDGDEISVIYDKIENRNLFTVCDNGCGMSEEIMDCIFSPGFSTKFDMHTGEMSSGIGLCHVKEIIEKREGKIRVESQEGRGTRFLIEIPEKEKRE
jgi:two-component system sensor histidine kinase YcbA